MFHQQFRWLPERAEVYLTQWLHAFGVALVSVFVPIYLLTLGFSLQQALLFVLVQFAVGSLTAPVTLMLHARKGYHFTLLLAGGLHLVALVALFALARGDVPFLLPAAIYGMGTSWHWITIHRLFLLSSDAKHRGSEVSLLHSAAHFLQAIAPGIGGMLAVRFGFPALMLAAACVLFASVLPLTARLPERAAAQFSWTELLQMRRHRFVGVSVAEGFAFTALAYLLPLLIYLTLFETRTVGFIKSLDSGVSIFAIIIVGRLLDRTGRHGRWLTAGSVLLAGILLLAPLAQSRLAFTVLAVALSAAAAIYFTSYDTIFYDLASAEQERSASFVVVREILVNLGRMSALGMAIILPLPWAFGVCAAALIVAALVSTEKRGQGEDRGARAAHPRPRLRA